MMFNSIKILKQIDSFLGPVLVKILPTQLQTAKPKDIKQILVIRPGGLGDALLLLPALKAVSKKNNFLKIDILCEKRNQEVFHVAPYINDIFSYKSPADLFSIFKRKYDVIIDTEQSHYLSAVITRFLRADLKSGFKVNNRQKMYDISFPYDHDVYEAKVFWNLIDQTLNINKPFVWDFPYFRQKKTHPVSAVGLKKIVCIFPGATIKERLWPEEYWAQVIDEILQSGWQCILLGGPKENLQCKTIMQLCKTSKCINLCSHMTIQETAALLEKTALLISTDSGILHLGVVSNTPTISLFGSGIAAKWAPQGENHKVINRNLDCSPCTKFGTTLPCPNKNACMLQITPKDVINSVNNLKLDHRNKFSL